jgi:plastocyanin
VRGHPLAHRSARVGGAFGIALGLLLSACQTADPAPVSAPSSGVRVVVGTAAGDTLAFDPAEIAVGSVVPVTLEFRNHSRLPHNLVFTGGLSASTRTIVEPGAFDELQLLPPRAGMYPFVCTIHSEMAGRLVVGASAE